MERQTKCLLNDGVVIPPTGMELIVSDHCNIACRQCNHGAPVLRKWNVDPGEAGEQLSILGQYYRPAFVKYIGGEPLLHPNLAEVISTAKDTGIADYHMLVTNGMLLDRMSKQIWDLIDELEISRYPGAKLDKTELERYRELADDHGVRFTLNEYPEFRRTFTRKRIEDPSLVSKIFRGCKIANVWGCHGVYKGALYRCPQSMYATKLAGDPREDGLVISNMPGFEQVLLEFLNRPHPLHSCHYCIGTAGRKEPHTLLTRKTWADDLDTPAEAMIDAALLEQNIDNIVTLDDCKTPEDNRRTKYLRRVIHRLGLRPKRMRKATSLRNVDQSGKGNE